MIGVKEIMAAVKRLEQNTVFENETDMELSLAREWLVKLQQLCEDQHSAVVYEQAHRKRLEIAESQESDLEQALRRG